MYFAENNYDTDGLAKNTVNCASNMSITVLDGR